jgi:hypothetical protein
MSNKISIPQGEVDNWLHRATFKHMQRLYELQKRNESFREDMVRAIVTTKRDLHKIWKQVEARKKSSENKCQHDRDFSKYELMVILSGVDRSQARKLRKLRRLLVLVLWEIEREITAIEHRIAIRFARPAPAVVPIQRTDGTEQLELRPTA